MWPYLTFGDYFGIWSLLYITCTDLYKINFRGTLIMFVDLWWPLLTFGELCWYIATFLYIKLIVQLYNFLVTFCVVLWNKMFMFNVIRYDISNYGLNTKLFDGIKYWWHVKTHLGPFQQCSCKYDQPMKIIIFIHRQHSKFQSIFVRPSWPSG